MSRDIRQPLAGAATALACAAIGAGWLWSGTEITPTDGRGNTMSAIADDPIVPEVRNPYDPSRSAATVAFWERKAAGDAQGAIARRELAGAYLARGRETGDIADAVKAEAAARESLKILPRNNANAMIRLARALLGQHRFPEAREVAERAEKLDPEAARLRADIDLELGRVAEAKLALAAIPDTPDDLNRIALQSRISLAEGRNFEAIALLEGAARRADAQMDMAHEAVAWYHTMVGHLNIDAGRLDLGEQACRAALAVFPRDYRAMTGMAEAAVFRGDWASAREWCRQALVIGPQNPEALRLLGEAHAALGQKAEAEAAYGRFAFLARSFPRIYDRHWIVFCADRGARPRRGPGDGPRRPRPTARRRGPRHPGLGLPQEGARQGGPRRVGPGPGRRDQRGPAAAARVPDRQGRRRRGGGERAAGPCACGESLPDEGHRVSVRARAKITCRLQQVETAYSSVNPVV